MGHHCKSCLNLLIADDDTTLETPDPISQFPLPPLSETLQLSLNALSGMPTQATFHMYGSVHHHKVTILVDGGSTHNFVQARVAQFLALHTTAINPLQVMIGDGGTLICQQVCPNVPLTVQGHSFNTDLFVLGHSGADIMLGVQ